MVRGLGAATGVEDHVTGQIASGQATLSTPSPAAIDRHDAADDVRDAIEVMATRAESRTAITIRVRQTQAHFRITPERDPQQPRLWCVSVRQCASGGTLTTSGLVWIDRPGMSRTELAETIDTIRGDIGGWLTAPARRDLCRWLLTAEPLPTPAIAAGLSGQPSKR